MRIYLILLIFLPSLIRSFAAEPVTLRLWHSHTASGFYKELAENFTKQHPNIKVITTNYPTDDLKSTLIFSTLKNDAPDVVLFPSDLLGFYNIFNLGEVPANWFSQNTFLESIQTTGEDNKYFGIPLYQGNHLMLYYNKSIVDTPATSWQEMTLQAPTFSQKGVKPLAMRINKMYWFISFLNAYDGFPVVNNEVVINPAAMKSALKAYKYLIDNNLTEKSCDLDCTKERFFKGEFAYSFNGIWSYGEGIRQLGSDLGVSVLPAIEGLPLRSMRSTIVLAFPNDSLHSEKSQAIFTLSNYLQSEEVQRYFYKIHGFIPVNKVLFKEFFQQGNENQKNIISALDNTIPMPASLAMAVIWPGMSRGVELYLADELTADQAVAFIQKKIKYELYKIKQLEKAVN